MSRRQFLVVTAAILALFVWRERETLAQATSAVLGGGAANPVATRESNGSTFVDPREIEGRANKRPVFCEGTAFLNMTTATTTQMVAASGSDLIYVCSYAIHVGGAVGVKLVNGTGTNCGTGTTDETPNYDFAAADAGINRNGGGGNVVVQTDSGDALCATSSAAVDVDIEVSFVYLATSE